MCKNVVELGRPQMTIIWRMRIGCSITKATDTHSEYLILIDFTRQKWLHDRAFMLRLCVYCLSCWFYTISTTGLVVLR